jgi:hypothetical protein
MNQRTLAILWLANAASTGSAGWTTGYGVDLAAGDGITTSTWTYANVGRREMKLFGYVVGTVGSGAAVTSVQGFLQSSSTGVAGTTWATVANSTFTATTYGPTNPIHVYTNDRYVRVHQIIGCLTTAALVSGIMVEQRAS